MSQNHDQHCVCPDLGPSCVGYKKLGIVHCTYLGVSGYNFQKNIVFFCLKIFFTFSKSVDPDEMQHFAAFHLGLHCLQKYSFRGFGRIQRVKCMCFHIIGLRR